MGCVPVYKRVLCTTSDKKLAEATVSTNITNTRQMFADAIEREWISRNPFDQVKAGVQNNRERMELIPASTIETVILACPDAEWRLLFALARYGGLRVPSEILPLKCGDVLWDQGKFRVTSPKTEHQGKPDRLVPMFPELLPHFQAAFDQAEPGSLYIFHHHRPKAGYYATHDLRSR